MDETVVQNALMGMLMGIICGMIPLILGLKKQREGLAIASVVICALSGAFLGLLLAAPASAILSVIIGTMDAPKKDGQ
jgi:hypothetical protein